MVSAAKSLLTVNKDVLSDRGYLDGILPTSGNVFIIQLLFLSYMSDASFTADESRKLAVLIARVWADPKLAIEYQRAPDVILSAAGINLGGRDVPDIPEKPAELATQSNVGSASFSSASSLSTITCPCTGCTASCAGVQEARAFDPSHINAITKLADSPEARQHARKMTEAWNINLNIQK